MNSNLLEELILSYNKTSNLTPDQQSELKNLLYKNIQPGDFIIESAQGVRLVTETGAEIIDLSSQTVNCILGQNDEWVSYNLAAQILSIQPNFLSSKLSSIFYLEYSKRLLGILGFKDKIVNHRQNNGTDVTELAIKSAKNASRSEVLMAFKGSYHGQSLANYHASDLQREHVFWGLDNNVMFMESPPDQNSPNRDALEKQLLTKIDKEISNCFAVIIEPIQVNNNVNTPSAIFFQKLDAICKKHNIPLILDEIQTGFGWLGELSVSKLYGIDPEFIALSKALTAGYGPLAVLIADKKYDNLLYGTGEKTNGADIRSLTASMAVIDRLCGVTEPNNLPKSISSSLSEELSTGIMRRQHEISTELHELLCELRDDFTEVVSEIRGSGLIKGILIKDLPGQDAKKIVSNTQEECLRRGVMVRACAKTIVIKPAIIASSKDIREGLLILREVLGELND
jgi:4-aminobutyrate aminotransferase-like enzyme